MNKSPDNLKKSALRGGIVVGAATGIQFLLAFITQVTLARLLDPALFGQMAFIMMLVMFTYNAINTHSDKFIIQKQIESESDINSLITFELILSLLVCIPLALSSTYILGLFGREQSHNIAIILLLIIPTLTLTRTKCLYDKNLNFVKARSPGLIAQFIAGISGILAAVSGLGIWSLVIWRLSESLIEAVLLNSFKRITLKRFSLPTIKSLISFSYPLTLSSFLVFLYYNMDRFIIDQATTDPNVQLGYYFLASQLANYFLKTRQILISVLFPVFSKESSPDKKNKAFISITYFMGFAMVIPACISFFWADEIVSLVFGEKWLPAATPLKIMFSIVALRGINANATYLLHSLGITKADLTAASLFCLILAPSGYYFTTLWGITGMALATLATNLITNFVTFNYFIKPITGKGFFNFFSKPLTIGIFSYILSLSVPENNYTIKITVFIFSATAVVLINKDVLFPILKLLKNRILSNNQSPVK